MWMVGAVSTERLRLVQRRSVCAGHNSSHGSEMTGTGQSISDPPPGTLPALRAERSPEGFTGEVGREVRVSWGYIWAPPDGEGGKVGWGRPSNGWAGGQPDVIGKVILASSTCGTPGVAWCGRNTHSPVPHSCLFFWQV